MPIPKHRKGKKKKPQQKSRQRKQKRKPQSPVPRRRKPKPKKSTAETPPTQIRPRRTIDLSADPTLTPETSRVISHCINRQNGNVSLLIAQIDEDWSQSFDIMEIQDTPDLRTRTHRTILVGELCAPVQIIQALPATGDYLLVSCGVEPRPDGKPDRNGIIVNGEGVVNEIDLGHGITQVCITETNTIWVGYCDSSNGSSLVAFDTTGNVLFELDNNTEYGDISESYAMNVISDNEVWVHCSDWSVVRVSLECGIVHGIKDIGVYGAKYLVVSDDRNRIGLQSGEAFVSTRFTVLDVRRDSCEKRGEIVMVDEDGKEWETRLEIFGNRVVAFKENCVVFFDLVL